MPNLDTNNFFDDIQNNFIEIIDKNIKNIFIENLIYNNNNININR